MCVIGHVTHVRHYLIVWTPFSYPTAPKQCYLYSMVVGVGRRDGGVGKVRAGMGSGNEAGKGGCWYVHNNDVYIALPLMGGSTGHAAFDGRSVKAKSNCEQSPDNHPFSL